MRTKLTEKKQSYKVKLDESVLKRLRAMAVRDRRTLHSLMVIILEDAANKPEVKQ